MSQKLPDSVQFLIAEDVREESGKKLSLLGVFAGDDINIEKNELGYALPSFAILILGRGARGKFRGSLKLLSPSGKEIVVNQWDELDFSSGANFVMPIKLVPFVINEFGPYTVSLTLSDTPYTFTFSINGKASS